MIAQATGGTISVTGEKGRTPVKPGLSLGDTGTGMTMAITILWPRCIAVPRPARVTGYRSRCRTRCCTTCAPTSDEARSGKAVERDGTHSGGGSNAPSGLYPCAPGGTTTTSGS